MLNNLKYDKYTVEQVKKDADIRDYIPGCTRKAEQVIECPYCHAKKMSVVHKGSKNFAHCFSCDKNISNAIEAVMLYVGIYFVRGVV